jgi:hypothetical protein
VRKRERGDPDPHEKKREIARKRSSTKVVDRRKHTPHTTQTYSNTIVNLIKRGPATRMVRTIPNFSSSSSSSWRGGVATTASTEEADALDAAAAVVSSVSEEDDDDEEEEESSSSADAKSGRAEYLCSREGGYVFCRVVEVNSGNIIIAVAVAVVVIVAVFLFCCMDNPCNVRR